jgi:diguanylate cyclase (GGDEF)-like protein
VNLAYPVGDVLLLGLVVGGTAMVPGRRKLPWLLLAAGYALITVGDVFNVLGTGSFAGGFVDAIAWPTFILLVSVAVWIRSPAARPTLSEEPPGFRLPALAAFSALVILFVGSMQHVGRVSLGLAATTLVVAGVRSALSLLRLRSLTEQRRREAITDQLTGLGNRRALFQLLDELPAEDSEGEAPARRLAFMFLDLDRFKEVNDSFGHPAGDELLRQLGARLEDSVRESDLVVRLGGDEFVVALLDAGVDYAATVAGRLAARIEEPFVLGAVRAQIGVSIGIAALPDDATDPHDLVRCADLAMYRAKVDGKRFAIYQEGLDGAANRMQLVEELRETTAIADFERSQTAIERLHDVGLVVSVDDFGAGFTSLAYLGSLAVKELKLDRTFITRLSESGQGRDVALVRATVELAHALGLRVVAEGVEDDRCLGLLTGLRCDLVQGYVISKPKPAGELELARHVLPAVAPRRAA